MGDGRTRVVEYETPGRAGPEEAAAAGAGPDRATRLLMVIAGFAIFVALWLLVGRRVMSVTTALFAVAAGAALLDVLSDLTGRRQDR